MYSAVYHQCQQRGYATPVDVLIDAGVLPKQKYEGWRYGKVPYLEQVCTCNLKKLSFIMSQDRTDQAELKVRVINLTQGGLKAMESLEELEEERRNTETEEEDRRRRG